jgi:hypothetical protein
MQAQFLIDDLAVGGLVWGSDAFSPWLVYKTLAINGVVRRALC